MVTFDQALSGKGRVVTPTNEEDSKNEGEEAVDAANISQTAEEVALDFFGPKQMGDTTKIFGRGLSLASTWEEDALLGHLSLSDESQQHTPSSEAVYMNTHDPFCFAAVGVRVLKRVTPCRVSLRAV